MFLTRLVSLFVERGEISESEGTWALKRPLAEMVLSVPLDVRGTLQRQLDRLAPADRRALSYASIEGEEFSSAVLAALVGEDELSLQERLAPLHEVHGLIQMLGEELWPDGQPHVRYRFAHALYQSVLHESLVSARRAQLHRRAAEVLVRHFGEQAPLLAVSLARHSSSAARRPWPAPGPRTAQPCAPTASFTSRASTSRSRSTYRPRRSSQTLPCSAWSSHRAPTRSRTHLPRSISSSTRLGGDNP